MNGLNYHRMKVVDEGAKRDEYEVEKILDHRIKNGKEEYLTQWKGCPISQATWEPPGHFFHRYAAHFVRYCKERGLHAELMRYLKDTPQEEE